MSIRFRETVVVMNQFSFGDMGALGLRDIDTDAERTIRGCALQRRPTLLSGIS
jgi:hypothetical protein